MRYRYFVAVGCVLVCGLSLNASIPSISEYKKQLGRVINELNQKEDWIETANEEILLIEANIKESDTEIATVAQEITDLESNIGRLEGRIDVLETDQAAHQAEIDDLTDSVSWHLHAEYRLQKNHWLKNLLDYDEPKKRARFIRYHQYVVRSKSNSLNEFNLAMTHLNQTSRELHQERSLLNHERDIANRSKQRLDEQVAQREVQITNLETEIHNAQIRVEKLTLDQQRIRTLILEIDALGLDVPSEFTATNESPKAPVEGEVVREFGESRADGRLRWNGVVFAAKDNSDVVAVAAGRVVMADWLQGYGLIVIIDHGDDVKTIYANCNTLLVESGDYAEAGEVIAKTGQSGGSTIPGLYFEVLENGEQVDPILWLKSQDD
ncbi:MAG: peptidoglycan DD-metalloendopeptidase family protein [Gammaproteobacteria bacterium]|nr:peptidoglycan DD-metalloendopeptidase family protein [Gammaproteobacteria bacterium]MYF01685.1 peptidoglycan DD-metalloendopeptidase family protein [Gammaproteobacteria bacterium]MYI78278.1 peptidoglycan DD-metalloendopeptidase family protein [Gammaproteobacteria bacterium]